MAFNRTLESTWQASVQTIIMTDSNHLLTTGRSNSRCFSVPLFLFAIVIAIATVLSFPTTYYLGWLLAWRWVNTLPWSVRAAGELSASGVLYYTYYGSFLLPVGLNCTRETRLIALFGCIFDNLGCYFFFILNYSLVLLDLGICLWLWVGRAI